MDSKSIIEDLMSQDPKRQCKAIKNISQLQSEITPEKFRKEFMPFLIKCISEEDDEVLSEICKVSRDIFNCVGGKKYLKDIFPLIELLLHTCDPSVRKDTITSFRHYIDKQDEFSDIEKDLFEVIQKLAASDDPSHEIGFIAFSSEFFKDFKEKYRNHILSIFKQFIEKKSQGKLIKIELSANLFKLAPYLSKKDFIELFNLLMKDKLDSVRFNLVEALVNLKESSNLSGYENFIGDSIVNFSQDESWRVRLMLAKFIPELLELSSKLQNNNEIKGFILKSYVKLLQDPEGEVRSMACKQLDIAAEYLGKEDGFNKVLNCLKSLKSDSLPYVRNSLASIILSMAPKIGEKKTNEYIFPIFQDLIKDEDHDIRMVIIKNLDKLNEVVNIDNFVQGIIPSLVEISDNSNWRVRCQVEETVPVFARIVNKKLFFESIMPICLKWLTDPVYAIRQRACKIMVRLYDIFKGEDFEKQLLSKISSMAKSDSYLIRITAVILIREFLVDDYEIDDFMEKKLFPYISKLSDDKIPNVRQACSIAVKKLVRLSKNKDVVKECKSIIDELKKDKDMEVVYAITDN